METTAIRKFKVLKEGDAKFYIKSFYDKDEHGKKFISNKNNQPYIKGAFRVTDSDGTSETLYKIFSLSYKRDILKLLKAIGKFYLEKYIETEGFDWSELEDESGFCRIETKTTEKYGEISSIESFIKKDIDSIEIKRNYGDLTIHHNPTPKNEKKSSTAISSEEYVKSLLNPESSKTVSTERLLPPDAPTEMLRNEDEDDDLPF